jgi:phage-related protein
MTATFTFQYNRAYQVSSQWKTITDEVFSGREQRRNMWTTPRRKWSLEFDKNGTDTNAIMAFFDARKGSYEAFYWTWQATHPDTGESMGGDGNTYLVRFDTDELNISHIAEGFSTFNITLVEVKNL